MSKEKEAREESKISNNDYDIGTIITKDGEKYYTPLNDFIFKYLFGRREHTYITKDLLEVFLEIEIKKLEITNKTILDKKFYNGKVGILDIAGKINGNIYLDIEMQVNETDDLIRRILFYASKMISEAFSDGKKYKDMPKILIVVFANYKIKEDEIAYIKGKVCDTIRHQSLTDELEFCIIEMKKINKNIDYGDRKNLWVNLLRDPKKVEVSKVESVRERKIINDALRAIEYANSDEETRYAIEMREKYNREMASAKEYGRRIGKKDGEKDGETKEKIKIAKAMLDEDIPIRSIAKCTGLSEEEIIKLKEKDN